MSILIFKNQAILDEIGFSPDIEGGIGPVKIGDPVKAVDGRVAICHPFSEVDLDWFSAYTQGENPQVVIVDKLPADFVLPLL
jgi:hypothetical protein